MSPDDAKPITPANVPKPGGNFTYTVFEYASPKQLKWIEDLRRKFGYPETWDQDLAMMLGAGYRGDVTQLSQAAASWVIHNLQTAYVALGGAAAEREAAR